jgi:hypothetical protein
MEAWRDDREHPKKQNKLIVINKIQNTLTFMTLQSSALSALSQRPLRLKAFASIASKSGAKT